MLYFPCLSNWSSRFSPALCCQQNITRLQSVSWSKVITSRRNSEGKNLTREGLCCLLVSCCPESVSDLSNWFKLNWHGALPGVATLLYILEPFWAVNAFRVKKACAKETGADSQQQGQRRAPGGHVKTDCENAAGYVIIGAQFWSSLSNFQFLPPWQRCPQVLARRPRKHFFFLSLISFIYCNIYEPCQGKILIPAPPTPAWRETGNF